MRGKLEEDIGKGVEGPFSAEQRLAPRSAPGTPFLQLGKMEVGKTTSSENYLMFFPSRQRNGHTSETKAAPGALWFPAPASSTARNGRCMEGPALLQMGVGGRLSNPASASPPIAWVCAQTVQECPWEQGDMPQTSPSEFLLFFAKFTIWNASCSNSIMESGPPQTDRDCSALSLT